jgi:AraC-like DNA-binding protein
MKMPPPAAVSTLFDLIDAKWTTQALGVAAELRIADHLTQASDIDTLASATGCDAASLHRLLRALATLQVCAQRDDGGFELGPLGALLRSDAEPSLRSWAIWSARYHWGPWGQLIESVRTGKSARELANGKEGYGHIEADPQAAGVFNGAMVEITRIIAGAVAGACDFSAAKRVVDVGGGYGELLTAILSAHPHLHGVLFDLPHAIRGARARIDAAGFASRCDLVEGSFFESLPSDCDVYVLKSILHNWDDERCEALLATCRRAMPRGARMLIVERVVPERITGGAVEQRILRSDLNMLVGLGGRERTLGELEALLQRCGLDVTQCTAVGIGFSVVEALAE